MPAGALQTDIEIKDHHITMKFRTKDCKRISKKFSKPFNST